LVVPALHIRDGIKGLELIAANRQRDIGVALADGVQAQYAERAETIGLASRQLERDIMALRKLGNWTHLVIELSERLAEPEIHSGQHPRQHLVEVQEKGTRL
jgi:hypothetical protein